MYSHRNGIIFHSKPMEKFGDKPSGDITKIDEKISQTSTLRAGFPASHFNYRKREGFEHPTQGTLFYDVVRIIRHHRPKAFILKMLKV